MRAGLLLVALLGGCGTCPPAGNDVLFLGDSLLAWNEKSCRSLASNTAVTKGWSYTNAAVNGALMSNGDDSIPLQVTEGSYAQVILIGGANDLNQRCSCGTCEDTLDRIASADGTTGVTADLVDQWVERGSDVLILGYYPVPDRALYGFDKCFETISELDRRHALVAEQRPGVRFFDLGDVLTPENTKGHYAFDYAHPSPKGAKLLGGAVAAFLE